MIIRHLKVPTGDICVLKGDKGLLEFISVGDYGRDQNVKADFLGIERELNGVPNGEIMSLMEKWVITISTQYGEVAEMGRFLPNPVGRKYALNFALADDYIVDAKKLVSLFNPKNFMIKITPLHLTQSCEDNNIITTDGYDSFIPYEKVEKELKDVGFDVLVFIPSYDEDLGLITCGNAILSGSLPKVKYIKIK